jgi:hypothetical protein
MANINEVEKVFADKGCRVVQYVNKKTPVVYVCACGTERRQMYRDFVRRACRSCSRLEHCESVVPEVDDETDTSGEVWRRVLGGWVSSLGRARNVGGRMCTLCPDKFRYFLNGRHEYASRLVARAFKISDFELLDSQDYVVLHIDGDLSNNSVSNLVVVQKGFTSIGCTRNVSKDEALAACEGAQARRIPDFPHLEVYDNGAVWNGRRFLKFSKSKNDGYLQICLGNKQSVKVYRLVCYAFHPISGKKCLVDYDDMQVNHVDGNPRNNAAGNLEWVSQSANMAHAYNTGLNSAKLCGVLQYTRDGVFVAEYPSVAEAARQTGEKEHSIREYIRGKPASTRTYDWRVKDPAQMAARSQKYSCK